MLSDIAKRFWSKVNIRGPDECWEWQAYCRPSGYGQFAVYRRDIHQAHRIAWELTNGPIPDKVCVLHKCDNPPCCNPDHLFLGTKADNSADAVRKGRIPKGECQPASKLTEVDVVEIRIRYGVGNITQKELGREFGVNQTTIQHVVQGITWGHVPETEE